MRNKEENSTSDEREKNILSVLIMNQVDVFKKNFFDILAGNE